MRNISKWAAVASASAIVLAACGDAPSDDDDATTPAAGGTETETETDDATETETDTETDEPEDTGAAGDGDFYACMVSDAGGWDDQSFNQSGAEGMEASESALGIQISLVESQSSDQYETNVNNLVGQGCDLIFGVGFLLEGAIQEAATANPDVHFALIDSPFSDDDFNPVELDNGKPILFNTAEAAFLAGYVAAALTETGTVATFGGIQIPSVTVFMDGFADGITQYNEDNGTSVVLLGWDKDAQSGTFSGDFDNQTQGQVLTDGFIAQGADIILPVAGPVGLGAASAARSAGDTYIIWVDSDGYESTEYGDIIITSVMKQIGESVEETIETTINEGFDNTPYVGTLENGGVGLAPFHDFEDQIDAELQAAIDDYTQRIISGDYVVESPSTP